MDPAIWTNHLPAKLGSQPAAEQPRTQTVTRISYNPAAAQQRLARGRAQSRAIIECMAKSGVKIVLFGSMRSGRAHPHSDIDLLVLDCGSKSPELVIYEIGLLEEDIPVDVTILSLVPAHSMRSVMESAHG